jgi:ATP-dependent DNA ligase
VDLRAEVGWFYRCIAVKDAKRAQLYSRNHNLFNFRFPTIATHWQRSSLALTADAMKQSRRLEPNLVAQIEFTEWTDGDRLRHSKLAGLREDKDPQGSNPGKCRVRELMTELSAVSCEHSYRSLLPAYC